MKSTNITYLPQVDHLRAVAALLIIFYHGLQLIRSKILFNSTFQTEHWIHTRNPLAAVVVEGHTAVALFMVLSGFIFAYGTFRRPFSVKDFWFNRIVRIYPLFIVVVFFGMAVYAGNFSLPALLQTLLPLANMPGGLGLGPVSTMFWTISVEVQFYLLFPFLMSFIERRGLGFVGQVILLAIILRLVGWGLGAISRDLSYSYITGRIDQFLLGILAAICVLRFPNAKGRLRFFLIPSAILVVMALYGFHSLGGWPVEAPWKIFWPTVEGLAWASFVACYVGSSDFWPSRISWTLCKIGEVSFSVYLLHFIVIDLVLKQDWILRITSPAASALLTTLAVVAPLTLALSFFTYNTIELPFLNLRKRYVNRTDTESVASTTT